MQHKIYKIVLIIIAFATLAACKDTNKKACFRVGVIDGPETILMETAAHVAEQNSHDCFRMVPFSDYAIPNAALNEGNIDANIFQHQPFLTAQNKARGYKLVPVAKTFIFQMGIYSSKIKDLASLPDGAVVGVPNDPSNEERALLLLEKAGLIRLKQIPGKPLTLMSISQNEKHLKIVELDAAQLPRALEDMSLAVINTNYAIPAGLSPQKDALFSEDKTSRYVNLVVVKQNKTNDPRLKSLIQALHSETVLKKAHQLFGDAIIAGFSKPNSTSVSS